MTAHPDRVPWFYGSRHCEPLPPCPDRSYRLVLIGPPGAGKGTQADLLCRSLNSCHLSTGDVFRNVQCQGEPSPKLQIALEAMRRGELISDELVVELVRERTGCLRCRGGFILDGFPRSVAQAEALQAILADQGVVLDAVISYVLPLEEVVARLSARRSCPACNASYHLAACPPVKDGVCDRCGHALIQRADDRPESIQVRLLAFEESTRPLTDFYRSAGKLISIDAAGTPDAVLSRTLDALNKRLTKPAA